MWALCGISELSVVSFQAYVATLTSAKHYESSAIYRNQTITSFVSECDIIQWYRHAYRALVDVVHTGTIALARLLAQGLSGRGCSSPST